MNQLKTHHHNDKDVADEAGYENDGEGDWNKEQSQSPDHLLILVIEDHHLLSGVELARVLQLNILISSWSESSSSKRRFCVF